MSIELNKLRLGNYVFDDENNIMKVSRLETAEYTDWNNGDEFSVTLEKYNHKNNYWQSLINGIPLWSGILEKVGFVDKGTCWNFDRSKELGHHFGDFAISKYDNTQIKIWRGDRYCGIVHCEFFHELQNLVSVLSDFELSVS